MQLMNVPFWLINGWSNFMLFGQMNPHESDSLRLGYSEFLLYDKKGTIIGDRKMKQTGLTVRHFVRDRF